MREGDLVTPRSGGPQGRALVGMIVYDPRHGDKVVVRFGSIDRLISKADLQRLPRGAWPGAATA
jgi:hypothetical protein